MPGSMRPRSRRGELYWLSVLVAFFAVVVVCLPLQPLVAAPPGPKVDLNPKIGVRDDLQMMIF